MTPSQERLEILEMIQNGTITSDEGLQLLEALGESQDAEEQEYLRAKAEMEAGPEDIQYASSTAFPAEDDFESWKSWWILPFWIGVGFTILGGWLMYLGWAANGIGLGFIAAWIPFLIGLGLLVLGWNSRTGPWLHVRIHQAPGETPQRIAFSFPLPVRFMAWGLRTFGSFIKNADLSGADQIILALGDYSPGDPPLSIDVDDGDDGEKVKIYIG